MINIVIPMAGAGSRFVSAGYIDPKPLIKINDHAMIELVINNLRPADEHRFIFVCQKSHIEKYDLKNKLTSWAPNCEVVEVDGLTEGAACTVLCAKEFINNDNQLMIANSDQYVDIDINEYFIFMKGNNLDGLIMTMDANDPKWSYVGFDEDGHVNRVVEKEVISNKATVGIYNFKKGSDFVRSAEEMIKKDLRVNGEYYVAPVYNQLIKKNWHVGVFPIGSEADGMYGLGIPSDLDLFKSLPVCRKAIERIK